MDRISGLSDELLIKILSFIPTKVAVSTSILSKRWEFLWMWLSKLEFGTLYDSKAECKRLRCFLHRTLPLHRAPVIESFRLKFRCPRLSPQDIKLWVLTVVSRYVRELKITYHTYDKRIDILPSSLYICKTLVTLKLKGTILVDVPRFVCLPCLKILRLEVVTYFNEGSLSRLLSICPVLEDLLVVVSDVNNMGKLSVIVPSLRRLVIDYSTGNISSANIEELVLNTPSLNYLKLEDFDSNSHYCLIENMPKLEEAYVNVCSPYIKNLISSFTNVKHLTLCSSETLYGNGFVFNELEHLNLCMCHKYSLNVLVGLLKVSPKLRILDLDEIEGHEQDDLVGWNQPSTVPECMLSSLQTFEWLGYLGRPEERDVAIYILENARRLKTATISSQPSIYPTLDMLQELAKCSRASRKCQLLFD